ncbi:hypothetical protein LTR84_011839 [Exophiala bonariae]|uniref:Uncharacterized protein n=1 Tax=Exophiala bonariae TaxID=1690606 RepID=A0AAV9NHB0_9EURO|nr:hypothetical protein LTR84_011839 [Exophiala bonariae]
MEPQDTSPLTAKANGMLPQTSHNVPPSARSKFPQMATIPALKHTSRADDNANASLQGTTGALREIIWSLVCVSLPMIVLTAIFIGLVYGYLVSEDPLTSDDIFGRPESYDQSAYYVRYSATRLITVSSWTSTVTSFTTTFVMTLVSYPLARSYTRKSDLGVSNELPTTYQFKLIIGLLGGSLGSLWSWLDYCLWRKPIKQTKLLWTTATALLASIVLSFGILAVDTWLHITTSTVPYDTLSSISAQPAFSYGRVLDPFCWNSTTQSEIDDSAQCIGSLGPPGNTVFFPSASETARTLTNLSTVNSVLSCNLRNTSLAYVTAARRDSSLDFQANTYAMSTTCKPVSQECNLEWTSYCTYEVCNANMVTPSIAYNCSPTLSGNMLNNTGTTFDANQGGGSRGTSSTGFFLQLFEKDNYVNPIGTNGGNTTMRNPFYFTTGALLATTDLLASDPEAISSDSQNYAFILSCVSTVYDFVYNTVNGTVVNGTYTASNDTLTANIRWALGNVQAYSRNALESAWISGAQQVNTSQGLSDFFAQRFSETAMSMVVGITQPSLNIAERTREHLLVTRLPKAPFFTLIVLNLLYAVLGVLLAVVAVASQPRATRDVQARLSIAGLVAALFEVDRSSSIGHPKSSPGGIEIAFAEYREKNFTGPRVMVVARDGSHAFEKTTAPEKGTKGNGPATAEDPSVSSAEMSTLLPQTSEEQAQITASENRAFTTGRSSTY